MICHLHHAHIFASDVKKSMDFYVNRFGGKIVADMFMEGGGVAYQLACAAAIQNMMLAAHALGLGTVWYTLFDRKAMGKIVGVDLEKTAVSIICLGKPAGPIPTMARKDVKEKISYRR